MGKTAAFAFRTFPEFKEAAQALAVLRFLYERSRDPDGVELRWELQLSSINEAFNTLIAKGLPPVLAVVDAELAKRQGALDIAQDIMRFLLNHPAARRALATNFPAETAAYRVLSERDAGVREAEENEGDINEAGKNLKGTEEVVFNGFLFSADDQDGVTREEAAAALAGYQAEVVALTNAKGALQRAMATQPEYGSRVRA